MHAQGIPSFPYFVGIDSLADLASRGDRVCVLNILGGESRQVTPTSHAFSGGNVAFGTSPGRGGQVLKTAIGDIPVFNNVREGLNAGHAFNTGVVYLPPSGVRDGVAELIRVNPGLKKIVIVTEKIAVHDAREIRAMAQGAGVDVIGGNCLGVADSWSRVRIGGALGGDHPAETLLQGTVAVFSNSGGFTTTIAQYLSTEGWGTTTLVSSGKDVYIHYGARDFAHALRNDGRSRAAVLYAEPGGYYEQDIAWGKPVVACVVGRWKSKLTRAVGHAGAMAGAGDSAADKERWFMEAFGVDAIFTPEHPVVSKLGAVVTNIAHIPAALTAVMAASGAQPDFAPRGSLTLKAWMANDQGITLPAALALPPVTAPEPYARAACQAGHAGRRGDRAPEHEGQVGRLGDGPEDAGHLGARALGARTGAAAAAGQLRAAAGARGRGTERPRDARHRGGRRGQPGRRPGAGGRRRGARRWQFTEHDHGRGGGCRRPEARRACAGLHARADRPVRRLGSEGRPPRRVRQLAL